MNNKQNNVNRGLLDTQRVQNQTQYNGILPGIQNDVNTSRANASALRDSIIKQYGTNAMPAGMAPNDKGWFNLPSSGGGDYSGISAGYQNFADTGNAGDYAKPQAGYDEFARTGGVDATALRQRATAIIPSFYDAYKRNAQHRASVQGGFAPGFDAQMAEIGRQQGREGFNASRQVEGDIADKVQAGKEFGITGQAGIANSLSGNKLSGLGGLTNVAQAGDANAARNQQMQLALAQMYQQNDQFNKSGLANVYGQDVSDRNTAIGQYLSGLGGLNSSNLANIGTRSQIQDKSFLTDVLPGLVGAGGAIASGLGGIGAIKASSGLPGTHFPIPTGRRY